MIGDAVSALEGCDAHVLIASPVSPRYSHPYARSLAPVVLWTAGGDTHAGLLTSSSTRWQGLVSAADLAPAVLSQWGIRRRPASGSDEQRIAGPLYQGTAGREVRVVPAADALPRLDSLDRLLTDRYRLRFAAGKWYLAYGGLVLVAALVFSLWWPRGLRRLGAAGLAIALAPVGLLVAPIVGLDRAAAHLLAAAAIAAAAALLAARIRPPARALAAAMLLGAGLIAVDVVFGSPLMRRSTFGFGVMFGARFYGIGNEYMGFLAAMAVIGLSALLQAAPRARWLAALAGLAVVLAIGAPRAGANWGGAFAAAAGLVTLWLLRARKPWLKSLLVAVAVLAASALAPAALDLLRPAADRTHIGVSAAALLAGDGGMLKEAISHKAAMNWGLLLSYRLPLLIGFLLFAGLLWRLLSRSGPVRQSLSAQPALAAGLAGAVVLAFVAAVVNDSGIVAAAAALGVTASALIFVAARPAEARA